MKAIKAGIIIITTVILTALALSIGQAQTGIDAQQTTFSIKTVEVATGFTRPLYITHAGDGSGRLFIVEQDGKIKIIQNGATLATPFLDIGALTRSPGDNQGGDGERGLLGLAFHPNYATNGYFYINYTDLNGDTVVARYSVSGDPNVADAGTAKIILTQAQPASNHNGGQIFFGLDGYLYISFGDGGGGGDPDNLAQDKSSLHGNILRIDVDSGDPYAIPSGNPFISEANARDEIWHLGLRNPWRSSFDRLTGDLYIGDVGQSDREEISFVQSGSSDANLGWPCKEGFLVYSPKTSTPPCNNAGFVATLRDPIVDHPRSEASSITGGYVYRGNQFPAMYGSYFYGDFGSGRIWTIKRNSDGTWTPTRELLDTNFNISSFGEDEAGELYFANIFGGQIFRIEDTAGPSADVSFSTKQAAQTSVDPGELLTYTIRIQNIGVLTPEAISLVDTLPNGMNYVPNSLGATAGSVNDSAAPMLTWSGSLTPSRLITVTYAVTATGEITGTLVNTATITGNSIDTVTVSREVHVPKLTQPIYLPTLYK